MTTGGGWGLAGVLKNNYHQKCKPLSDSSSFLRFLQNNRNSTNKRSHMVTFSDARNHLFWSHKGIRKLFNYLHLLKSVWRHLVLYLIIYLVKDSYLCFIISEVVNGWRMSLMSIMWSLVTSLFNSSSVWILTTNSGTSFHLYITWLTLPGFKPATPRKWREHITTKLFQWLKLLVFNIQPIV